MILNNPVFFIGTDTPALGYTQSFLETNGYCVAPVPSRDVTHLILNIPTFTADGSLVGGGNLTETLEKLPENVTIIGGNLNNTFFQNHSTLDLLQNEVYLAENAAITAECALRVSFAHFHAVMKGTPVLLLGWGRIAKCLAKLLQAIGADVSIAARKEADIAIAHALGYDAMPLNHLIPQLSKYRIIFNTVPAMILPNSKNVHYRPDCLKIDLASKPGIAGSDVIIARGLPGKMAPESAGHLIAKTILELSIRKEVST